MVKGIVVSIKDGVAKVIGLNGVQSGEMVYIGRARIAVKPRNANAMILSLNEGYLRAVIFDQAIPFIFCGDVVRRSRVLTSIPLSLRL